MDSVPYSLPTHPPIICPVPRAVNPDACPTFISPSLFPQYGAGSVVESSTEISRRYDREEVYDDLPMSQSNEEIESAAGIYPDQMVDAPKRRERLKIKTKDKIRELNSRLMERVKKAAALARYASSLCPLFTRSMWVASPNTFARGLTSDSSLYRYHLQMRSPSFFGKSSTCTTCSPRTVRTGSLPALETVRLGEGNDGHYARMVQMATAIANQCHGQRVREDIDSIYEQLKNHTRAYLTTPDDPPPTQKTSISARLAAFYFSTLVPMDLVSKFPQAHGASIALDNAQRASQDMALLSNIWDSFIGDAPGKWSLRLSSRMRLLREADFKKLCNLMEEGLRCWAYWTRFARQSETRREEDMDNKWRRDDVVKIASTNDFDAPEIAKQLIVVGWKYVDLSTLRSTMEMIKSLDTVPSSARDEECQRTKLVRRWSMTVTPPQLKRGYSDEVVIEPFRSLRFSKDNPILVEIHKKSSNNDNTVLETVSSSSDILREVNEKLDAAISQRSVSPPASIIDRKGSQLPRPLTIRKARPVLSVSPRSEPSPQSIIESDGRISAESNIPRLRVRSIPPSSQGQRFALKRSNAVRVQNRRGTQDPGPIKVVRSLRHSSEKVNGEANQRENRVDETPAASARTVMLVSKIPVVHGKHPPVDRP
jgi:hypothetical protein